MTLAAVLASPPSGFSGREHAIILKRFARAVAVALGVVIAAAGSSSSPLAAKMTIVEATTPSAAEPMHAEGADERESQNDARKTPNPHAPPPAGGARRQTSAVAWSGAL
jgi:hypothetical protein